MRYFFGKVSGVIELLGAKEGCQCGFATGPVREPRRDSRFVLFESPGAEAGGRLWTTVEVEAVFAAPDLPRDKVMAEATGSGCRTGERRSHSGGFRSIAVGTDFADRIFTLVTAELADSSVGRTRLGLGSESCEKRTARKTVTAR